MFVRCVGRTYFCVVIDHIQSDCLSESESSAWYWRAVLILRMKKHNKTKRPASSSPEDVIVQSKTRACKIKQQRTMAQQRNVVQMGKGSDAAKVITSEDNTDSSVLSLTELRKLIQQDIAQANSRTMTCIDGVAKRIDGAISKLQLDVDEIKSSQQFISDEFESVKKTLSEHSNDIRSTTEDINTLKGENCTLRNQLDELYCEVNALKQKSLESNFLISNMIKTNDENLGVLLERIARLLNIPYDAANVLGISRLASKNQKDIQPVLVRCSNIAFKDQFMSAFKERPVACDEIGLGVNQRIYINHHLTPSNQRILGAARKFRKDHNYRFVWFSNGFVFLRKDENSKIIRVSNIYELPSA